MPEGTMANRNARIHWRTTPGCWTRCERARGNLTFCIFMPTTHIFPGRAPTTAGADHAARALGFVGPGAAVPAVRSHAPSLDFAGAAAVARARDLSGQCLARFAHELVPAYLASLGRISPEKRPEPRDTQCKASRDEAENRGEGGRPRLFYRRCWRIRMSNSWGRSAYNRRTDRFAGTIRTVDD
jgi:hypothetical protein